MNKEYIKGVMAAAEIADSYNGSTSHSHRLGDCIMGKLNVLPVGKRIRTNTRKIVPMPESIYSVTIPWDSHSVGTTYTFLNKKDAQKFCDEHNEEGYNGYMGGLYVEESVPIGKPEV